MEDFIMSTFPVVMKDGTSFNLNLADVEGKGDDRIVKFNGVVLEAKQFKSLGKVGLIAVLPDRESESDAWTKTMAAIRRAKVVNQIEPHVDRIGKAMELLVKRLSPKLSALMDHEKTQIDEYLENNVDDVKAATKANLAGAVESTRKPFKLSKAA
jgi:hypothetical protein